MSDDGKNPGTNTRDLPGGDGYDILPPAGIPIPDFTPNIPGFAPPGPSVVPGASQSQKFLKTDQTGIAYDLLSEGPIEGLVHGASSVFLNGTLLRDFAANKAAQAFKTKGSISSGSSVITVTSGALDDIDTDTDQLRYVSIFGAGTQPSDGITFSISANSTRLTASSSFFTKSMTGMEDDGTNEYYLGWTHQTPIIIRGADFNGGDFYTRITRFVSDTEVHVEFQATTTVTGADIDMGLIKRISTTDASANTITLHAGTAGTTVSDTDITVSAPVLDFNKTEDQTWNYSNVAYAFKTGTTSQTPLPQQSGVMTNASYAFSPNITLLRNTSYGGKGSDTVVSSDNMGLSNAPEIDRIKLNFEIPAGLYLADGDTGDYHKSYIELKIYFEYSNDDGATYQQSLIFGRPDGEISEAGRQQLWVVNNGVTEVYNEFLNTNFYGGALMDYAPVKVKKIYEKQFNIERFQPFDRWRVRIKRVSSEKPHEEPDDVGLPDKFNGPHQAILKNVEAMVTDCFNYPLSAYAAVRFGAEDFPQPPQRAYHLRGMKIQVPTNYITREEAKSLTAKYTRNISTGADVNIEQDWDGNFRGDISTFTSGGNVNHATVYCNNPAWVFYDICTNNRYGLGNIIDSSMIDKYSLYSIARYCDELVSDGQGGLEPRFTCNVYLGSAVETYKVLKDLATVFRGILYWINGQLKPVQDAPSEPVYTFTQGNVIQGQFEYETVSDKIKKNQIKVAFNDPNLNFAPSFEIVEDYDDIVENNRFITQDVIAFGCTSRGQARRVGLWHLLTSRQETEIVKFRTSTAGSFITPGDVIFVQDHLRHSVEYSGRISAGSPTPTTTTFGLDRAVTLASGSTYEVSVFFPGSAAILTQNSVTINSTTYSIGDVIVSAYTAGSPSSLETITSEALASSMVDDNGDHIRLHWAENGHLQTKTVSTSAGATSHLTVSSAFTEAPEVEAIWALRNTSGGIYEPQKYKVLSLAEDEEGNVDVVASFHFDRKYDAVDQGYATSIMNNPSRLQRQESPVPKPTELSLFFQTAANDRGLAEKGTVVSNSVVAQIQWAEPVEIAPTETIYTQIGSPHVPAGSNIASDLNDTDQTIYINDATFFSPSGGYAKIGTGDNSEWIKFTGTSFGSPQALTGVTRGINHTTPKFFTSDRGASVIQFKTVERKYSELAGYEVEIHTGALNKPIKAYSPVNSYISAGMRPGTYKIKVRTLSTRGSKSDFTVFTRSLEHSTSETSDKTFQLPRGGFISTTIKIDTTSGLLTFHHPNFVLRSVTGNTYEYENVSEVAETVDFGGMIGGNIAFLAHHPQDESPFSFANDFKAVEVQRHDGWKISDAEVSPTITASKQWLKVVGESGSPDTFGLSLATGTISITDGSLTVTGSGTAFTTEFKVGDMIRFDTSSTIALNETAYYGRVANIISNTELTLTESINRTFSGDSVFRQSFRPDYLEDSLITRVVKDDADKFTLLPFSGTIVGPNAVQSAELASNSVGSVQIITGSVDADVLSEGSITNILISANAIEAANIAAEAINQVHIAANSIESVNIASETIQSVDIAANAIENVNVAANAIGTANITAGSIDTVNIAANAIRSAQIESGTIDTVNIAANAIESANITSGAIDTVNIAANAITFQEIESGSIQSVNIAANAIGIQQIAANSIDAVKIAANAIGIQEIAAGSVDSVKIAANAIAQTNIQADAISNVELSTNAVINANIASDSIESANMSAGSVLNAAIAANSIEQTNISAQAVNAVIIAPNALENFHVSVNAITGRNVAEDSIEQAMIAANAIGTAQIAGNSIGAAAIVAGSVGVASMAANSIGTTQIIAGSIDTTEIAADAITSAKIDAGAVDSAAIAADAITAAKIDAGAIETASIASGAITTAKIAGNNVTTASIAAGAVDTAQIAAGAVETAKIAANNITTALIVSDSIETAHIKSDAITTAKIDALDVGTAEIAAGAITTAKIAGNNITTATIAAGKVDT